MNNDTPDDASPETLFIGKEIPEALFRKLFQPIRDAEEKLDVAKKAMANEIEAFRLKVNYQISINGLPFSHRLLCPHVATCIDQNDPLIYITQLINAGEFLYKLEEEGTFVILLFPFKTKRILLGRPEEATRFRITLGITNGKKIEVNDDLIEFPFSNHMTFETGNKYTDYPLLENYSITGSDATLFWKAVGGGKIKVHAEEARLSIGSEEGCLEFAKEHKLRTGLPYNIKDCFERLKSLAAEKAKESSPKPGTIAAHIAAYHRTAE